MEIYQQRDVWRCASTMSGAQCVMTCGMTEMHVWSADSWDCLLLVSTLIELFTCNFTFQIRSQQRSHLVYCRC